MSMSLKRSCAGTRYLNSLMSGIGWDPLQLLFVLRLSVFSRAGG